MFQPGRGTRLAALLTALVAALGACSTSGDSAAPPTPAERDTDRPVGATITLSSSGCAYDGPVSTPAGQLTIGVANETPEVLYTAMLAIDGGHTFDDLVAWVDEQRPEPPRWVTVADDGETPPGGTDELSANVTAGVYGIVCATPNAESSPILAAGSFTVSASDSPATVSAPAARGYAMMADLPGEPGVVLLGGGDVEGPPDLPDQWTFEPDGGWRDITPAELPTFSDRSLTGIIGNAFEFDPDSGVGVFADIEGNVWVFDPTADSWQAVETDRKPSAMLGTSFVLDVASHRLIAFGGFSFGGGTSDETWSYDLDESAWVKMSPKRHPSARNYYQAAYDPISDRVILFGGSDDFNAFDDTWVYDVDSDGWTELAPELSPPARTYGWMVYDPIGRRMILFGGTSYPGEEPMVDTWAFDPKTETWTELDAPGPSARGWHAMAYDAETETIVLFGGGVSRDEFTAETWLFDPRTDTWRRVG